MSRHYTKSACESERLLGSNKNLRAAETKHVRLCGARLGRQQKTCHVCGAPNQNYSPKGACLCGARLGRRQKACRGCGAPNPNYSGAKGA